jgi:hypothetical protein
MTIRWSSLAQGVFLVAYVLLVFGAIDAASAAPFGMSRDAPPDIGGFAGWILAEQARFYLMLSHTIRAAKADGSAAYTLSISSPRI